MSEAREASGVPQAILITGVYGVGKTTTTGQVADLLEAAGIRYAALDLDWLSWAWSDDPDDGIDHLLLEHLGLVVGNLRRRGNDRFVLAGAVADAGALRALRETLDMPLRTVRLVAPLDAVRARLANEPTTGRDEDARRTEAWLTAPDPDPIPVDLEVAATGTILDTAQAIVAWTGWLERPGPS